MIKVDKNVPVPPSKGLKYPLDKMEIGDSFFVEGGIRENVYGVCDYYARVKRRGEFKFISRMENGGVRVWRIK